MNKLPRYDRHIVLDLEFSPIPHQRKEPRRIVRNEIIQIGAVMLDENYRKISTFSTYVRPMYFTHIQKDIQKLTGITDQDVVNAPSLPEALETLVAWIGPQNRVRVYSWSDTDLHQLRRECELKELAFPSCMKRWMDFQKVYGHLIGCRHQLSLKNAIASANGQFVGAQAHTALYDAMATSELLLLSVNRESFDRRTKTMRELLSPQTRRGSTIGDLFGSQLATLFA